MLVPILLFIVGLVLLIKGGDWFVDGATGLAHRFHVPEILIGATVVSIGTTLPEVMVSATSAVSGHGEIAYGNAIGSVICNTALIAALTIAIRPSEADRKSLRTPVIFFFVAAVFYAAIAYTNGAFTRLAGIVLLAMFVLYMVLTVRQSFRDTVRAGGADEAIDGTPSMGKDILLLVVGAAFIAVGANLLVNNGTLIAQGLGVPEAVIALTVPLPGAPGKNHRRIQCFPGGGYPPDAAGDAAADGTRAGPGQALPLAGHRAVGPVRRLLRIPVLHVSASGHGWQII